MEAQENPPELTKENQQELLGFFSTARISELREILHSEYEQSPDDIAAAIIGLRVVQFVLSKQESKPTKEVINYGNIEW